MIRSLALTLTILIASTTAFAEDSMIYRARIACLNKRTDQVETLRFTSGRGHFDDQGNFYEPRLSTSLNMERHIFQDGTSYGASQVSLGALSVDNTDGAMDLYRAHGFDGREVVIEATPDERSGPWRTIWKGASAYHELDWDKMLLKLSDRQEELARKPVQEAVYAGENEEIEGEKKPLVYGKVLNAPMALVDANNLIYQVSARPGGVRSVEKVFDSGVELGTNMIKNGEFDDETYWNAGSDWRIIDGKLHITLEWMSGSGECYYDYPTSIAIEHGVQYVLTFDVVREEGNNGLGSWGSAYWSPGLESSQLLFADTGHYSYTFTASVYDFYENQKKSIYLYYPVGPYWAGTVDNISLTPVATDHPTRAELEAAAVPKGGYHTCLAEGLIRLGAPPDGQVTADVVGTAPATVPEICRQLLLDQASFSVDDFDDAAFAALSNANPSTSGVYLSGDETFQEALDLLMGSVGGWWGFDRRQGKMTCGRVELPSTAALRLSLEHESLSSGGVTRKAPRDEGDGIPAWRVTLNHTRNWTVQGSSELIGESTVFAGEGIAGVVSETRRVWLSKEYREAVAESAAIQDAHPLAPELSFDSLLLENASAEASRRLAFYSGDRERFVLTVPMELLFDPAEGMRLDVGGAVELVSERFGLAEGKTFLVLGMTEVYDVDGDTVELDVLG